MAHERDHQGATVWRERTQLTHTIKDGWRVGDVTVEVTYSADDPISEHQRQQRLHAAIESGQQVAERHNRLKNATITKD